MPHSPYEVNFDGKPRSIGIEIEFSGLKINEIAEIVISVIGGEANYEGKYQCTITENSLSEYGDLKIELDAALLKGGKLPKYLNKMGIKDPKYTATIEDFLSDAAMEVVPMEIITPPIPLLKIHIIEDIREALRIRAAEGTRDSVLNAFGLHLNPELPSLKPSDIRDFLRAFIIMYDWLMEKLDIDTSRRLTPYIDPFPEKYGIHIMQPDYNPDISTLIDDYLDFNPTRNRPLDMLPLFTFLDKDRVLNRIDDGLTSSRPTFHYRLPNCEISNPDWTITREWNYWVIVERVAHDKDRLSRLSKEYLNWAENPVGTFFKKIEISITNFLK